MIQLIQYKISCRK